MYNIQQFSKMTGVSPSSLRFYERKGLFQISRTESNYRKYTYQDAFVVNKLKTYLEFGFSVSDAIDLIHHNKKVDYEELIKQRIEELGKEEFIVTRRKKKLIELQKNMELLKKDRIILRTTEKKAFYCVHASNENDFSVSEQNKELLSAYVGLLPVSDYAVIYSSGKLYHYSLILNEEDAEFFKLAKGAERIACDAFIEVICYSDERSLLKEAVLNYAAQNNYTLSGIGIEIPAFIALDENGKCICSYYLPIK